MDYNETNYLCHHGVKGMKWGVRRQQKKADKIARKQSIKDDKIARKQAIKDNRMMYRSAKKNAKAKYSRDTAEADQAYQKIDDHYYNLKTKQENEMARRERAVNAGFGEGSKLSSIQKSIHDTQRSYNEEKWNDQRLTVEQAWESKYSDVYKKASSERNASIKKARDIYKSNKQAIASGNYDVVKRGKKKLGVA